MSLDFTVLENITNKTTAEEKQAPRSPLEPLKDKVSINTSLENKEAVQGQIETQTGNNELIRRIERKNIKKSDQKQIISMYTENLSKASIQQSEILKGIKAGDDIYNLFFKAIDTIELLNNNKAFSSQAKEDIIKVYGEKLGNKRPLEIQLEETHKRYSRLKKSLKQAKGEDKQRIEKAIIDHRQVMEKLANKINSI